ncbi:signal peptidase complex subunit 1 [Physcomitrium patens]|uniref:Signal peptidase complex subunit 1 n=1 Tax=Physcomitrium patens TaxID=3218 RepID=A0A2K1KN47_PHYPA|nr:probable signal peptidase complex subunit 1 [Physcomitrium patens]PNR55203.1 hypothetical protein PHYPA_006098 [Physcomitrium patens]|eukprot:XP_024372774.1 probable signal peptidase complex subunit 1 [Physcomitrella patens]
MDWEGQRLAEQLMQYFLLGSAVVAFIVGYVLGSFTFMLYIYLAGVVVTFIVTVPDWPFFNRHPLTWLEPMYAEKPSQRLLARRQAEGKKGAKASSKR